MFSCTAANGICNRKELLVQLWVVEGRPNNWFASGKQSVAVRE